MPNLPTVSFLWPELLWLLALLPLLALAWWRLERRRGRMALRYPALMPAAAPAGARHLATALLFLAVCALVLAAARPQAAMLLPSRLETVALAIDISGSMRADDLQPTRMEAARAAAKSFVQAQPPAVRLSVVAVAGAAAVVQPPTRDREDVAAAIDRLQPQHGSALGSGLVIALATILPDAQIDVERLLAGERLPQPSPSAEPPAGAIVLLSDGQGNTGLDLIQAAEVAAGYGVRVYTIGIGTAEGTTLSVDGWSMRVRLDETMLRQVADITRAQYFQAADAEALQAVYRALGARLGFERREAVEITALVAGLGALLAMIAGLWSLWRYGRVL